MTGALILQLALLLHGHHLTMHLAQPAVQSKRPLIVYATGDGGWKRKDLQMYETLKSWGYPVAGFSSPDYLKHLGPGAKTLTEEELANDYGAIIDFAQNHMTMPKDTPVVLVGVSRGAGLAVAAAGEESLRNRISGMVVVGLTKEEEYVNMPDLYSRLPALGALPLAVVQSTHDNYLPAAQAQALFGPDNDRRLFRAIPSKNHSFSDARDAMYAAIRESLAWIDETL
jgi:pimeloyl-ACP methyl ester carboxylesterase